MRTSARMPHRTAAPQRERLDVLLVARGLAESRERAQAAIMAGEVRVNGRRAEKPGVRAAADAAITVQSRRPPYVSRGGDKLVHALRTFGIAVKGAVGLDVGASTGGFTDCLLQRGAAKVYAVDVGTGQLHWRLRQDSRVVVLERIHAARLDESTMQRLGGDCRPIVLKAAANWTPPPSEPGTYKFRCDYHPAETGTITVE